MYFKYYRADTDDIAIQEIDHVYITQHGTDGWYLHAGWKTDACELADAFIERLSLLVAEDADYVLHLINASTRRDWPAGESMQNSIGYDNFYFSTLKWYETQEEAEREIDAILMAIEQGRKVYDLTKIDETTEAEA